MSETAKLNNIDSIERKCLLGPRLIHVKLGPVQTSRHRHVELNFIKFDFSTIAVQQLIQTSHLIDTDSSPVASFENTVL